MNPGALRGEGQPPTLSPSGLPLLSSFLETASPKQNALAMKELEPWVRRGPACGLHQPLRNHSSGASQAHQDLPTHPRDATGQGAVPD